MKVHQSIITRFIGRITMLERVIRETCIAGAVIDRCIKASSVSYTHLTLPTNSRV